MLRAVSVAGATPIMTYYFGPFVHEGTQGGTSSLKYILTPEGRILNVGTDLAPVWKLEYDLKDHLGNVRVVVTPHATPGYATLLQENNYYPFGMRMSEICTNSASCKNQYKYNGKELQTDFGLNWYDYGARMYDPAIGRWHAVDPDAESYFSYGPYVYVGNNPIRRIDPDGNNGWDVVLGFGAAVVDNACGGMTNVRSYAANYVTDAKDFNSGLTTGDVASIAIGGAEISGGSGMVEGGTAAVGVGVVGLAAGGTGAVAIAGGAATVATGATMMTHGAVMMASATKNLAQGKGQLSENKEVNGNSKSSTKEQHNYDIKDTQTGNVVKTGTSGGKETKTGESYRGNSQANKWNKQEGTPGRYKSETTNRVPAGEGARQKALDYETNRANQVRNQLDPNKHQRP